MIWEIALAYVMNFNPPVYKNFQTAQVAVEDAAKNALSICQRTKSILENNSRTGNDIGSIQYLRLVRPEDAKKLFPSSYGLGLISHFIERNEENQLSTFFYGYKESKRKWDIAVSYLTNTGEPHSLYYAKGDIIYIEQSEVHMAMPPDLSIRLSRNKEDVNKGINLDRLKALVERVFYTCRDNDRLSLEVKFANSERVKPEIRREPQKRREMPPIPVKFVK